MTTPGDAGRSRADVVRPVVVGVVSLCAIVAMGLWRVAPLVELQLTRDVTLHSLSDLPEVQVRFDGRDAILAGRVGDANDRAAIIASVRSRWGVRAVRADDLVVIPDVTVPAPRVPVSRVPAPSVQPPVRARPLATTRQPATAVSPTSGSPTSSSPTAISPGSVPPTSVAPTAPAIAAPSAAAGPTPPATQAPTTLPAPILDRLDAALAAILTGSPIRFAKSDASPDGPSAAVLDRVAASLLAAPGPVVHIETHTDGSGTAPANLALSQKRAEAIRAALVIRGVPGERLVPVGIGEAQPVASDATDAGRQRNRRVIIRTQR